MTDVNDTALGLPGLLVFLVALVPIGFFLFSLKRLQAGLSKPDHFRTARRRALWEMPLILIGGPFFLTSMMLIEGGLDPDFLPRSFVNHEDAMLPALFLFALDQTCRGAAFDLLEVFKISLSPLEHRCASPAFCISIFIYRSAIGLCASILIFVIAATIGRAARRSSHQRKAS